MVKVVLLHCCTSIWSRLSFSTAVQAYGQGCPSPLLYKHMVRVVLLKVVHLSETFRRSDVPSAKWKMLSIDGSGDNVCRNSENMRLLSKRDASAGGIGMPFINNTVAMRLPTKRDASASVAPPLHRDFSPRGIHVIRDCSLSTKLHVMCVISRFWWFIGWVVFDLEQGWFWGILNVEIN
jgi:hypothetical protein